MIRWLGPWWLWVMAFGAIMAYAIMGSIPAHADPIPPNCVVQPWGFLGSQQRGLCDGPVRPDGSWMRHRIIATPAHQVPMTTSCYGTYYVSCRSYGGYFQPYTESDNETYPVTPDTVLPDEPGHLG